MYKIPVLIGLVAVLITAVPAQAQLDRTFDNIFNRILVEDFQLSPGPHRDHYIPAAREASNVLTPALNSLIASNVASFPLSSTIVGVTFDFSTGQPVSITESQGPIFAEIAESLGRKKLVAGMNATHLNLNRFRGMPLQDMRFTFTHEDLGEPGLGDDHTELDVVHVFPNLNVDANILALFATYGVTQNFDVGIALPVVTVGLNGRAQAVVESRTLFIQDQFGGGARHFFGGNSSSPELERPVPYDESATGIGDVAVRAKYQFPFEAGWGVAAMLDLRLPTGAEKNFMGTGSIGTRVMLISSGTMGSFSPHINLGYDYRAGDLDSDEAEIIIGFDQKIVTGVTFAFDLLGAFDLSSTEAVRLYDPMHGPWTTIIDRSPDTGAVARRTVNLSNVPDRDFDHTVDASVGFRVAPSERFQLLGNIIVPLQDGGLRSSIVPTIGLSVSL